MKTYVLPALKLTAVLIVLCSLIYPFTIAIIAKLAPGGGDGVTVTANGKVVGYKNIGQKFTEAYYFHGRPSAVEYNSAGSAGSNKGPSNSEYLETVKARIDTFLFHNPTVKKHEIPAELVTASGSGLDPHISVNAARLQVTRVAKLRGKSEQELYALIDKVKEPPLLGILGPEKINVLKLNIELNNNQH